MVDGGLQQVGVAYELPLHARCKSSLDEGANHVAFDGPAPVFKLSMIGTAPHQNEQISDAAEELLEIVAYTGNCQSFDVC